MKLKSMIQFGAVVGLVGALSVACAQKEAKPKITQAQAQKVDQVLKKAFGTTIDQTTENDRAFASGIAGGQLEYVDSVKQDGSEKTGAYVKISFLMNNAVDPVSAEGAVYFSDELSTLKNDKNVCGKDVESVVIQGRCMGEECNTIAVMISEKASTADAAVDVKNAAFIFVQDKGASTDKKVYKLQYSTGASKDVSGTVLTIDEALKKRDEDAVKDPNFVYPVRTSCKGISKMTETTEAAPVQAEQGKQAELVTQEKTQTETTATEAAAAETK